MYIERITNTIVNGLLLSVILLVVSCNSGDNLLDPGGGGTGRQLTTSVGPVSGFGSIIVNGVRYDDANAVVTNDAGMVFSTAEIRLGMMVEIRGVVDPATGTGSADTVTWFSEISGYVTSAANNTVVINGVVIVLEPTTVYYDVSSPAVGDFLEVYGVFDSAMNGIIATRVERKARHDFKLRGVVSNWDTSTERFDVGEQVVSYNGVDLPIEFSNGVAVRVYSPDAASGDVISVTAVRLAESVTLDNGERAEIVGVISLFNSVSEFWLGTQQIDATNSTYRNGSIFDLVPGRRIEVEGTFSNGRLVASEIEFTNDFNSSDDDSDYEVTGTITDFESVSSFLIRSIQIDASQAERVDDGNIGDLAIGVCVEIRGDLRTTEAGSVLLATRVKFRDSCDAGDAGSSTSPDDAGEVASALIVDDNGGDNGAVAGASIDGLDTEDDSNDASDSGSEEELRIKGRISRFTNLSNFYVGLTLVDASRASFDDGSSLVVGDCVEIRGTSEVVNGNSVLRAYRVKLEDDCDNQ